MDPTGLAFQFINSVHSIGFDYGTAIILSTLAARSIITPFAIHQRINISNQHTVQPLIKAWQKTISISASQKKYNELAAANKVYGLIYG